MIYGLTFMVNMVLSMDMLLSYMYMLILTSGPPASAIRSAAGPVHMPLLSVSMEKFVLVMLMVLLYMYMLMLPPVWSGLQVQLTNPSCVSVSEDMPAILLLLDAAASPTFMEKKVSWNLTIFRIVYWKDTK